MRNGSISPLESIQTNRGVVFASSSLAAFFLSTFDCHPSTFHRARSLYNFLFELGADVSNLSYLEVSYAAIHACAISSAGCFWGQSTHARWPGATGVSINGCFLQENGPSVDLGQENNGVGRQSYRGPSLEETELTSVVCGVCSTMINTQQRTERLYHVLYSTVQYSTVSTGCLWI